MVSSRVPVLLLLNGLVLASHTILARYSFQAGVAPLVYALASATGAAVFLFAFQRLRGEPVRPRAAEMRYGLVAGLVSVALPQVLIYSASAFVSAGVASLAYAFPTPLTYVLASAFGLERQSLGRTAGVGIAFAGAIALALTRADSVSGDGLWVGLAMLAPVSIAAGNIYRARFWPPGSRPIDLAFVMSAAAALWLAGAVLLTGRGVGAMEPAGIVSLVAASSLAAFGNVIYFELQKTGGIVSFSQIGYVGAVLGLVGGTLLLGERHGPGLWLAAGVIASGVVVSEWFKRRGSD
jgi:drug/metabolite transporter (DMT)-like permease